MRGSSVIILADNMVIDLPSFYKDDFSAKIDGKKLAIKESKCITGHYCYNKCEANKLIEPYLIVTAGFPYVQAPSPMDLKISEESFIVRDIPK